MNDITVKTNNRNIVLPKINHPKKFNVVFLNDDITPIEFVSNALAATFHINLDEAIEITYRAHLEGKAYVGPFSYEIAEEKAYTVMKLAAENSFPLTLDVEAA